MRESKIESYLKKCVIESGGMIRKLSWINHKNAPDRCVFLNGVHFVELKKPGEKPRKMQLREHARMCSHGANVYVIDSLELVDEFITKICH